MARKPRPAVYDVVDDLDGKTLPEGTEPTKFRLGGTSYELDLSDANAKKLNKLLDDLKPYTDSARQRVGAGSTGPTRRRSSGSKGSADREQLAAIRAWAQDNEALLKEHDLKVPGDRGRIAAGVVDLFNKR